MIDLHLAQQVAAQLALLCACSELCGAEVLACTLWLAQVAVLRGDISYFTD